VLSPAKLYQSSGRAADARAAFAPALQGFPPTPEFPEDRGSASAARCAAHISQSKEGGRLPLLCRSYAGVAGGKLLLV